MAWPSAARLIKRMALLALPLAAVGELGHRALDTMGATLAHHVFHIGFVGGAGLIFALFVARDVRRNGWPSFGWRTEPRRHAGTRAGVPPA